MANGSTNGNGKKPSGMARTLGSHPVIFGIVTVAAVAALAFFLLIVPAVRSIESGGSASIADAQARLDNERAAYDAEAIVVDRVSKLSTDERARVEGNLPVQSDVPGMIDSLAAIAVRNGVLLQGMDLTVTDTKLGTDVPSNVKSLDIAMNIAGAPYPNLKAFFGDIERNTRLIDFRGLTASPQVGVATVNLRTYFVSQ